MLAPIGLAMLKHNKLSNRGAAIVEKAGGSTIRRLQSFPAERIFDTLRSVDMAERYQLVEILKSTPFTTVYKVPAHPGEAKSLCIKQYTYTSLFTRVKAFFTSRPYRAWAASCYLLERTIPVIEVLAFVRQGTLPNTDHLFVTYLEHVTTLYEYSRSIVSKPPPCSQQRAVLRALAKSLALMHRHRIYHNDLKGQNVLIDRLQTDSPCCLFCDLDSITLWRRLSPRRVAKNLAQLNTSLPDHVSLFTRLRFFVLYLRCMEQVGDAGQKKKLLARAAAMSRKRDKRRQRRQRQ